jgi:phosphoribosylaminoimidazole-succinocarboxamide synthase
VAAKLPEPVSDPTTKWKVKDELVTVEQIDDNGWSDAEQIAVLREKNIILADSISLDEFRFGLRMRMPLVRVRR